MSSFSLRGFFVFVASASLSFSTTSASASTIVDLSKSFEVGNLDSSGAQKVIDAVSQNYTRRFLVLEKGKIVVDYARDDNVCNTVQLYGTENCGVPKPEDRLHVWSVTKSVNDALGIGLLVDAGLLLLEDTLGDIFVDDTMWANVTNAEYKQTVSIKELLTMTSGLVDVCFIGLCPEFEQELLPMTVEEPYVTDYCGKDLVDILNRLVPYPEIVKRGEYHYTNCISPISYIFTEVTGQGIRDYMASNVYPALGIDNNDIFFTVNSEGVEQSATGLYLSAYEMAKFGQLHLQKGMSSPNASLISTEWVDEAFTIATIDPSRPDQPWYAGYGYLWHIYKTSSGEEVPCADGAFGQYICIHQESERVFVRKSDDDSLIMTMFEELELGVIASLESDIEVVFSNTTVFESDAETDGNVAVTVVSSGDTCAVQAMNLAVTILAMILIIVAP